MKDQQVTQLSILGVVSIVGLIAAIGLLSIPTTTQSMMPNTGGQDTVVGQVAGWSWWDSSQSIQRTDVEDFAQDAPSQQEHDFSNPLGITEEAERDVEPQSEQEIESLVEDIRGLSEEQENVYYTRINEGYRITTHIDSNTRQGLEQEATETLLPVCSRESFRKSEDIVDRLDVYENPVLDDMYRVVASCDLITNPETQDSTEQPEEVGFSAGISVEPFLERKLESQANYIYCLYVQQAAEELGQSIGSTPSIQELPQLTEETIHHCLDYVRETSPSEEEQLEAETQSQVNEAKGIPSLSGSFEEAFAEARNKGVEKFEWNDGLYTTELATQRTSEGSSEVIEEVEGEETIEEIGPLRDRAVRQRLEALDEQWEGVTFTEYSDRYTVTSNVRGVRSREAQRRIRDVCNIGKDSRAVEHTYTHIHKHTQPRRADVFDSVERESTDGLLRYEHTVTCTIEKTSGSSLSVEQNSIFSLD